MNRVAFYTLGCKVNAYETEAMRELFEAHDFEVVDFNSFADIYIVNTCTVTHLGDRKSRQMLRKAKRINPKAIVVATGCYAQVNPDELEAIDEVDLIIGNKDRAKIVDKVLEATGGVEPYSSKDSFENLTIQKDAKHTRAYVKIQDGCNQYCSYCIVPYARGPVRSREKQDTLEEIKRLVENGYREVVLTGIHIASFGIDRNEKAALIDLLESIEKIEGLERIRLSSLEPSLITPEFLSRLSKLSKFCPHFHLSLQSGSAEILTAMRRKYTPEEYLNYVKLIRKVFPEASITTDIIVGFPGEKEKLFNETIDFVKTVGFSRIHIFPYSPRQGTLAAKMQDQVEPDVKKKRAHYLGEIEKSLRHEFLQSYNGKNEKVLFEQEKEPGLFTGYTRNYIPVEAKSEKNLKGKIKNVTLIYTGKDIMNAKIN